MALNGEIRPISSSSISLMSQRCCAFMLRGATLSAMDGWSIPKACASSRSPVGSGEKSKDGTEPHPSIPIQSLLHRVKDDERIGPLGLFRNHGIGSA